MESMERVSEESEPVGAEAALLRALGGDRSYLARYRVVTNLSRRVRSSEYLLTNACNIRCKGCWFFANDFDSSTKELTGEAPLREFVRRERERGINYAIIIGGEPTLIPKRIALFVEGMDYVTISTNGLKPFPVRGFERVAVQISLFGGGPLDDELRAIKPSGERFSGLFDTALANFKNDPRACFVFAICDEGIEFIDETVRRIQENGNRVSFNIYSKYGSSDPLRLQSAPRLLEAALAVKERYPETVLSHPYFIETLVTGKAHWGESFSYDVCPSISVDHPAHAARRANGKPTLPLFNAWAADCETVNFCCTSGHCDECRDSQAVLSWLQMNMYRFRESPERLKTWIEIAESYWKQFPWALSSAPPPQVTRGLSERSLPLYP
ncbi:MAG: radical SAM protein [Polyangiaceae bacterium]